METVALVWVSLWLSGNAQPQQPVVEPVQQPAVSTTAALEPPFRRYGIGGIGWLHSGKLVSPPNWWGVTGEIPFGFGYFAYKGEITLGTSEWTDPQVILRDRWVRYRTPGGKVAVYLGKWDWWGLLGYQRYLTIGDLRDVVHPGFRTAGVTAVLKVNRRDRNRDDEVWFTASETFRALSFNGWQGRFQYFLSLAVLDGDTWAKQAVKFSAGEVQVAVMDEQGFTVGTHAVAGYVLWNRPPIAWIVSGGHRSGPVNPGEFVAIEVDFTRSTKVSPFVVVADGERLKLFRSGETGLVAQAGLKYRF